MNPLLNFTGLPRFAEIKPEHVGPAVNQLLAEGRALVERLVAIDAAPDWDGFVAPLENGHERLARAWGQVSHLHSVLDSPELRAVYNDNLPRITQYYAELGQHAGLYRKYQGLRGQGNFKDLSDERRRVIENELRDFRLGGADLAEDQKARFLTIQEELAKLAAKFEENLLDATNAWDRFITDEAELAGVPDDAKALFRELAEADGKTGFKLNLQAPAFMPIMQFCANRALREAMYRAYVTRASEFGPATMDNTRLIDRLVELRGEAARMLGFANYAELSLEAKMARTPAEVLDFLETLAQRAKPYAERDMAELRAFAAKELGLPELQAWDVGYASEKLREARYAFSEQEVKQYFPEPVVLTGLFRLVETLYGLAIRPDQAPVWHDSVKFYAIDDRAGQRVGQFYLDLYARDSKRGGAWMDDAITRRRKGQGIQTPVAYLTCNFTRPIGDKPAVFSHDEVVTLFHEFGHGLHHLLTRVEELGVSGINGVEWDAVELPSQFMENFCWEWDVLKHMTAHVDSGAPLPRALFDKMLAAKNFQAGMQTLRQIEFALFDMHLYSDFDPAAQTPLQLLDALRRRIAVVVPPDHNRFPNTFSHIFAGGYAAGYYSYKWAEVLSADVYALFEEHGVLNPTIGERFWSEILGVGGSRDAIESFKAFRGREPTIDALLRHNGMV
ncbi:MAG: oligopeptidase A [Hydrogenophilaceae bacterium CG1_02_62_390]|nr:MAG: oligopeptidase A [Hydrogenophilaceae bacterium CG1_02_62_390]PIW39568.1 MAG: oligopeptidase A [Hydrogenophilales bacterium CG15_BIG_FIL_POST_REV_8_21_14_020_62_31]PIW71004.1 MAG: oligopeptidase A [Hydrogenophilales bacterium CG12_big_fil_rev_8_21_14_0_65_61_21]PIY98417.1 MAG: oligopeptidase A [Hydrogenophilales bacterium CG_4_10_14_0_8_um_filter_62_70]